ncbi:MAG: PilZ domain-containing protein [bacterium]|nr:PilZ domain-containing protein [bacterium]
MGSVEEKRTYLRIANEFNVRIAKEKAIDDIRDLNIDVGKSINISGSGLLITIREPVEIGARIRVTFLKPNTFDFFESFGRVVRIEDNEDGTYELAIGFVDQTATDAKRLDYYLKLCDEE